MENNVLYLLSSTPKIRQHFSSPADPKGDGGGDKPEPKPDVRKMRLANCSKSEGLATATPLQGRSKASRKDLRQRESVVFPHHAH